MLVFIHGAGCTDRVFTAQRTAFADAVTLTLPGRCGFGGSPESIEAFADAVQSQLGDLQGTILCGSSMGGAIALELALRDDRVSGVVLLGSGARLRVAPTLFESLERDFETGARGLAAIFFAHPSPQLVDGAVEEMQRVGQAQTLRDFRACNAFDVTGRVPELRAPLLALTGAHDALTPPKFAQWFADRVPGAQARILPDAGHLAMIERPDETNDAIRAFADRLAAN
jgi:pimeloyl-ACP methyl ester carboxylesterase